MIVLLNENEDHLNPLYVTIWDCPYRAVKFKCFVLSYPVVVLLFASYKAIDLFLFVIINSFKNAKKEVVLLFEVFGVGRR